MPNRMSDRMSEHMPKECQIECQNKYAIYTSKWYVRNYVAIVFPGGDHSERVVKLVSLRCDSVIVFFNLACWFVFGGCLSICVPSMMWLEVVLAASPGKCAKVISNQSLCLGTAASTGCTCVIAICKEKEEKTNVTRPMPVTRTKCLRRCSKLVGCTYSADC